MERESRMPREDAVRALEAAEAMSARAAGIPRGHALLQLLYAVMMSAYMAVFVYTGSFEGGASEFGGTSMALLLPPMIVASGLVEGAGQRYAGRLRATRRYWMASIVFIVLLAVFLIWSVVGGGYPWWLSLVSLAITLVVFGARPMGILRTRSADTRRMVVSAPTVVSAPLPWGSRTTTVVIGLVLGGISAVVFVPVMVWVVVMVGMILLLVASGSTAAWGLRPTGWHWGLTQWWMFGIAAAAMFLLATLVIATDWITPSVAIGVGVAIAASVTVSAFVPGRGDEEDADGASEA